MDFIKEIHIFTLVVSLKYQFFIKISKRLSKRNSNFLKDWPFVQYKSHFN